MLIPIPEFENEDEERDFWATHDASDYLDWSQAALVAPIETSYLDEKRFNLE